MPRFANCFILLGLLLVHPSYGFTANNDTDQEIDRYLTDLQADDRSVMMEAIYRIGASGLSDTRLFDAVEQQLIATHSESLESPKDKAIAEEVGHLMRALASSGKQKYSATFSKLLDEGRTRSIRNRAKSSIEKLSWYASRNATMQNMAKHVEGQSIWTTRFINLLTSPDPVMQRYGAEELNRFGSADDATISVIAQQLDAGLAALPDADKTQQNIIAWYCRLLGKYAKAEYGEKLTTISEDSSIPKKIRRHARKALGL